MAVPIADIAKDMGLEIIQGNRITDDFSIFGEIYFTAGKATIYDLFKVSETTIDVKERHYFSRRLHLLGTESEMRQKHHRP